MGVATPHMIEQSNAAGVTAGAPSTVTSPDSESEEEEEAYVTLQLEYKPLSSGNLREKLENE